MVILVILPYDSSSLIRPLLTRYLTKKAQQKTVQGQPQYKPGQDISKKNVKPGQVTSTEIAFDQYCRGGRAEFCKDVVTYNFKAGGMVRSLSLVVHMPLELVSLTFYFCVGYAPPSSSACVNAQHNNRSLETNHYPAVSSKVQVT